MRQNRRSMTTGTGTAYRHSTQTINVAGGEAFSVSPKLELASLMATTMLENKFYTKKDVDKERIVKLVEKIKDPVWVAKCCLFIRKEFMIRTVSMYAAIHALHQVKGKPWIKNFICDLVERVDDMGELLSGWGGTFGKPFHSGLRKGLALAFDKFDNYQLAKYRMINREVSLIDLVNLVHPFPTPKNEEALRLLMRKRKDGEPRLKSTTWEALYTQAGQKAETEEELADQKTAVWKQLLSENKLGYFALLRNLNNMVGLGDKDVLALAYKRLVDEKAISKSKVLPFRYLSAYERLSKEAGTGEALSAINRAAEISLANVPNFPGTTVVCLDRSGSMNGGYGTKSTTTPWSIGSLFAAAFVKKMNADLILFSTAGQHVSLRREMDLFDMVGAMNAHRDGMGTNFHNAIRMMKKAYDRIIFLSDMQGWMEYDNPSGTLRDYEKKYNCKPVIYSFNLSDYGTIMFPERRVYCLAGFSPRTFDIMRMMCDDPDAFIHAIDKIPLRGA